MSERFARILATLGLLCTCVSAGPVAAQTGAGSAAAQVLRLAPAPRPLALGGAYSALAEDELALFYNPARLSVSEPAAGMAYQSYPLDASAGSLAAAVPFGLGVIGVGVRFLNFGEIRVMEPDPACGGQCGRPTGARVAGGEVAASVGYGTELGNMLQIGVTAKMLRLQLAGSAATGVAYDAGLAADLLSRRLTVALALQNFGPDLGPERASPLPRTVRAGAALRFGRARGPRAAFTVDMIRRAGDAFFAGGLEVGYGEDGSAGMLRVGYNGALVGSGPTMPIVLGAGVTAGRFTLDYAYRVLGPFGPVHHFGVSFEMGAREPNG